MGNSSASWPSPPEHRRSQGCSPHFHGSKRVRVAALLQTGKRSLCFRRSKWRRPLWYFRLCACASSVLAYCKSLMKDLSHFGGTTLMRFMRCRPTEAYECCCCEVSSSWWLWGATLMRLTRYQPHGTPALGNDTPRDQCSFNSESFVVVTFPFIPPYYAYQGASSCDLPLPSPCTHKNQYQQKALSVDNSSPQCNTLYAGFVRVPFLCSSLCMFQRYLDNNKTTKNILKSFFLK